MALIRSVTVGNCVVDLHKFTGEVVEEKKWSTTQVSGGGGGYNVGSGQQNPVSISSSTSTHDQFFLKNENGEEMAVEMTNAGLALRKGHRVTVFWGVHQGQSRGPYLAVYNHTTNNVTVIESGIGMVVPPTPFWVTMAWFASIVGICIYGLGIVGIIVLFITGKARKARNNDLAATFRAAVDQAITEVKTASGARKANEPPLLDNPHNS